MKTRDFVILTYGALKGKIYGKTALQKKVYFLGVMLGHDLGYGPHYYGPYSTQVADANSELKSLGYLSVIVNARETDSRGFEKARYDFQLTKDGNKLFERKKKEYSAEWPEFKKAAEVLQKAGDVHYMALTVAAKAYFILNMRGKASLKAIKKIAREFGWSPSNDELNQAVEFLRKIDLVQN